MSTFVTVVHIITCLLLILVVLIQSGKGAEISASLGGSSQTVFGSSGGANFFTRFTSTLAAIFMACSLILTVLVNQSRKSVFEGMGTPPVSKTQPATGTTGKVPPATTGGAPTGAGTAQTPSGAPAAVPAAPSAGGMNTAPKPGGAPAALPGAPANNSASAR